ncbi:amidohydrolase family protein [Aspergillus foveolatus]|uniref:amidohydrolase family protein n=1 Tax=Aspergillus foveolatus TaxID=210207 RepID=UPI003CCCAE9A
MAATTQSMKPEAHIEGSGISRKNRFLLPPGAFDTHVHVFDPRIGPYAANRAYTPDDAPLENLVSFNRSITQDDTGSNIVLVQPSPYRTDCTVMMKCLQELRARQRSAYAIAVLDLDGITDHELERMHTLGVRGIRLNFQADGKGLDVSCLLETLQRGAERIRHLPGWMIQLFVPGWAWDTLFDVVTTLPVPIIADHLGGLQGASKLPPHLVKDGVLLQTGFASLLTLAKQSKVIVKVSGLYRASSRTISCFDDTRPIIEAFAREIPDQCIWGSDWPHTGDGSNRTVQGGLAVKEPFRVIDDQTLLEKVREWVGNEVWEKIMRENPARIFQ